MTAAELKAWSEKGYAVFNPHSKPIDELPVIYGFNNGGSPGWYSAVLIADSGHCLGGHVCSHEGFMPGDLGILESHRADRHETFRKHYPDGYRMDFVPWNHPGVTAACERNKGLPAEPEDTEQSAA